MKAHIQSCATVLCLALAAAVMSGCATTGSVKPYKYKATDGRTIVIGKSSASNGGLAFDEPHMDKCWTADGFDFNGYDTLYIAPIASIAKMHDDDIPVEEVAKQNLVYLLTLTIGRKGIFTNIVAKESDIKPGAKTLKLSQTIVDYSTGGAAVRYFVAPFAGRPDLRVHGVMTDGDKTVFDYTIRRSGTSAASLVGGVPSLAVPDEYLQTSDIRSMVLDLTDFIAAISGRYTPK
jgi:hypothetical protein